MQNVAELIRQARTESRLSRRELGRRAGVAGTTIGRIEDGTTDPTLLMVERIMNAAGRNIHLDVRTTPRLVDLINTYQPETSWKMDWTHVRAIIDYLTRFPDEIAYAITDAPTSMHVELNCLIAGIAEKLADDHQLPRPEWTEKIPPLDSPSEHPGTPKMRQHGRDNAPQQLSVRNIHIAAKELWRHEY
jgi:transcriptional regulator with XRE-family HTH domain